MKQTKTTLTICALVLAAGIFVGGENRAQQTHYRLTPEQQKTVQFFSYSTDSGKILYHSNETKNMTRQQIREKIVENIDPILVSKYLVFSDDWLKIIGDDINKQVTRQQFKRWTNNLDKVYECYKEFMGKGPISSDIIPIHSKPDGLASANHVSVSVNLERRDMTTNLKEMRQGSPTYTMLHEMAHVFSYAYGYPIRGGKIKRDSLWMGEKETAAELLVSYALEKGGFKMGYRYPTTVTGPKYRHSKIGAVKNKYDRREKVADFGYHNATAYDLYMFGLVELVGWDTMKKAVQSYKNGSSTYMPETKYEYDSSSMKSNGNAVFLANHAYAHEFFDRLVYFHDQARELGKTDKRVLNTIPSWGRKLTGAQVLRRLPDKGKFLDEYFTVKTTPL